MLCCGHSLYFTPRGGSEKSAAYCVLPVSLEVCPVPALGLLPGQPGEQSWILACMLCALPMSSVLRVVCAPPPFRLIRLLPRLCLVQVLPCVRAHCKTVSSTTRLLLSSPWGILLPSREGGYREVGPVHFEVGLLPNLCARIGRCHPAD